MAITVVNPGQQQQGQGMNQWLTMLEGRNERLKQLNEIEMENFGRVAEEQVAQRGGWGNVLADEGGEDFIREYLDKTMGLKPEKADSFINMIRNGFTPDEMRYRLNRAGSREFHQPGTPQPQQGGGQVVPQIDQTGRPVTAPNRPVDPVTINPVPTASEVSPDKPGWAQLAHRNIQALEGAEKEQALIDIAANQPELKAEYDAFLQRDAAFKQQPGRAQEPRANALRAIEQRITDLNANAATAAEMAPNVEASLAEQRRIAQAENPVGYAIFNSAQELLSVPLEERQAFWETQGESALVAPIAKELTINGKPLFPNGIIPFNEMSEQQKSAYTAVKNSFDMQISEDPYNYSKAFIKTFATKIANGPAKELNTGTPYEELSEGKQKAASAQAANGFRQVVTNLPTEIKDLADIDRLSRDQRLQAQANIEQFFIEQPAQAAETYRNSAAVRKSLTEDQYKKALTKATLAQANLMEMQTRMAEVAENDPEAARQAAVFDLFGKVMGSPEMYKNLNKDIRKVLDTALFDLFNISKADWEMILTSGWFGKMRTQVRQTPSGVVGQGPSNDALSFVDAYGQ